MDELIYCSHRMVYTNQTICWDPIETERSEATIPRRSRGDAKRQSPCVTACCMITVTGGSKRPCTRCLATMRQGGCAFLKLKYSKHTHALKNVYFSIFFLFLSVVDMQALWLLREKLSDENQQYSTTKRQSFSITTLSLNFS